MVRIAVHMDIPTGFRPRRTPKSIYKDDSGNRIVEKNGDQGLSTTTEHVQCTTNSTSLSGKCDG